MKKLETNSVGLERLLPIPRESERVAQLSRLRRLADSKR